MLAKCYPIITAQGGGKDAESYPNDAKWRFYADLCDHMVLYGRNVSGNLEFRILLRLSFPLLAPHKLLDSELFNIRYPVLTKEMPMPDKLRFLRIKKALQQKDVAAHLGMGRASYSVYEEVQMPHYATEYVDKLSALYETDVSEFLDDYNRFVYRQVENLRALREKKQMGRKAFARYLGVGSSLYSSWEKGKKLISIRSWEKYIKGKVCQKS